MNRIFVLALLISPICRAQTPDAGTPNATQTQTNAPPPNPKVQKALEDSISKLSTGDSAGALASVNDALRMDPYIPQAWVQRAIVESNINNWNGAVADTTKAIQLGMKTELVYNLRSQAYFQNNMLPQALADAEEALRASPQNAMAFLNRAQAREALKYQPDDFLSDYKNAALLNPSLTSQSDAAFARNPGAHRITTLDSQGESKSKNRLYILLIAAAFLVVIILAIREQIAKRSGTNPNA